jgi:hypothetical protein
MGFPLLIDLSINNKGKTERLSSLGHLAKVGGRRFEVKLSLRKVS